MRHSLLRLKVLPLRAMIFGEHAFFSELQDVLRWRGDEQVHDSGDDAGPAALMTGAKTGAVVAVKVFVEQQVVAPLRILLEFLLAAKNGASAIFVPQKDAGETAAEFLGDFVEIHFTAGAGGAFDGESVAVVGVVHEEGADDKDVDGH